MAEENQAESGPEANGAGPDAVALGAAMARASGAVDRELIAYLADQRHHLHEQFKHLAEQYKQLRLITWEKRLGVLLRIATAFVGLAVAATLAFLIWSAANSNNLVIDAFAVPPDLAARGLSGPVLAAKLSDRIAAMQAETVSGRPAKSYANGLSEDLKLEIPETGVSLGELDHFLRQQLGHDVHIAGEMVEMDKGVAITGRVGADSATVTGPASDTDTLLQKLAERVYGVTQPYRYAVWLEGHGRTGEAMATFKAMVTSGPLSERPWAYNGWGNLALTYQSQSAGLTLLARGHAVDPDFYFPLLNSALAEERSGRLQEAQRDTRAALALLLAHGRDYARPQTLFNTERNARAVILRNQGALLEATAQLRQAIAKGGGGGTRLAEALALLHSPGAARAALAENPITQNSASRGFATVTVLNARQLIALEAQDWPGVLAAEAELPQMLAKYPGIGDSRATMFDPRTALALAHMGQFAAADARLKFMPADCYPCLIARAQVAAFERQDGLADAWFARAVAIGPSFPYAESDWGHVLLDRSKPDAAIQKFKLSNEKGPHFGDSLEGWGEALMAKNQSDLALAKFAEADKYAPNWGRLHLKWGEALVYAGKPDEAKAQFARAAQLDLTPSEKAELAGITHG